MTGHYGVAAVEQDLGTGRFGFSNMLFNTFFGLFTDDRAEVLTDHNLTSFFHDFGHNVIDRAHAYHGGTGHAALARATRHASGHIGGRHFGMGVGQHHQMIFGPAEGHAALEVAGGADVHDFSDFGGAHEGHGFDVGMVTNGFHNFASAVHYIQHTVGQAGFF